VATNCGVLLINQRLMEEKKDRKKKQLNKQSKVDYYVFVCCIYYIKNYENRLKHVKVITARQRAPFRETQHTVQKANKTTRRYSTAISP